MVCILELYICVTREKKMLSHTNTSELTAAAEELIKATSTLVEATSITLGQRTVEGLKNLSRDSKSVERSVESVERSIIALRESTHLELEHLNQNVNELKDEISKLNENHAKQIKNERLQWALQNIGKFGSFEYYNTNENRRMCADDLARQAIVSFRKEGGRRLGEHRMDREVSTLDEMEASGRAFREALQKQLYDLIGVKPRIGMGPDGVHYAIFYS
jgi:hypothetical protein